MVDSLGKKLEAARVKKQMTIEDVARVTKIRPHSIADLERDDYSNFPSLAYAKYLGVDVSDVSGVFGHPNEFGMSDYEYLTHITESEGEGAKPHRPETERNRSGSKATIIILVILIIVGGAFYYGAQFLLKVQRLAPDGKPISTNVAASPASPASSLAVTPKANGGHSSTPEAIRRATLVATPTPAVVSTPQISATPVSTATPTPAATPAPTPSVIIRRAVPVFPTR